MYEIYIALRNILTYKINLPQRLHSDMEPINESTYFNFKMSVSIKQKEEGDFFFAYFNMAEGVIISKQQETVLPRFSHCKVDCIVYM